MYNATTGKWENGAGGGGGLLVNVGQEEPYRLDKTYSEIEAALNAGMSVVVRDAIVEGYYNIRHITQYGFDVDTYYVYIDSDAYAAAAKTDYPTYVQSSV